MTIEWKTKNVLVAGGASFIGSHLTDALLPLGQEVRGLRLHGWVEQDVLDTWLVKAQAVLVPQQRGFASYPVPGFRSLPPPIPPMLLTCLQAYGWRSTTGTAG